MRTILLALLVIGCGEDAHDEVACLPRNSPFDDLFDTCERACDRPRPVTSFTCEGVNEIGVEMNGQTFTAFQCEEVIEYDGARGCCAGDLGERVFRFFECR